MVLGSYENLETVSMVQIGDVWTVKKRNKKKISCVGDVCHGDR